MNFRVLLVFLLPAVCIWSGGAQPQDRLWPELKGKIDPLFREFTEATAPSARLALLHKGDVVFQNTYGHSIPGGDIPFTADTPTPLASITKSLVATAILELERAGELGLEQSRTEPDYVFLRTSHVGRLTLERLNSGN